jgi:ketosteroid isomerase-like protein
VKGNDVKEPTNQDEEVRGAVLRFYEALDALVTGQGTAAMEDAWHHTSRVTASHPMGEWSYGWQEILATWEVVASVGSKDAGGATLRDLRVVVYGDVAYTTCIYVAGPKFGGVTVNCTNVLHRDGGAWKLVHHHADKSQKIEQGLAALADEP